MPQRGPAKGKVDYLKKVHLINLQKTKNRDRDKKQGQGQKTEEQNDKKYYEQPYLLQQWTYSQKSVIYQRRNRKSQHFQI